VNGPQPGGWSERARRLAATVLIVAFALWFAASILRAIASVLILVAVLGGTAYVGVLVARYRRSRW
jgi:hypothetical protein